MSRQDIIDLEQGGFFERLAQIRRTPESWHAYNWRHSFFYRWLVTEVADYIWEGKAPDYYFQAEPNLRIQPPGEKAVPWHTDAEFGHLDEEWNVWLPLTPITHPSQTVWVDEGVYGKTPTMLQPGQAFIFLGAMVTHGNMVNETDQTRRSMDFRLIRQEDFRDTGASTVAYGVNLSVGEYWRSCHE